MNKTKPVFFLASLFACTALFVNGATYRNLPSGYTQVESLTSSGGAYIITTIAPTTSLRAELDFIPLAYTGDANVGSQTEDGADWRFFNYSGGSMFDVGSGRIGLNGAAAGSGGTLLSNGTRYIVSFGRDSTNTANQFYEIKSADGTQLYRNTAATSGSVKEGELIYIFGGKNGDGAHTVDMTLYSFIVWDDEGKVGDFVPCTRDSDGEPGLYDIVGSAFYPNVNNFGSAAFTAGAVVPAPDAPLATLTIDDLQPWEVTIGFKVEKLGSHGTYGDLYFAFGLPGAELEPVKVAEGLGLNATHAIRQQGLNDSTTYAYAYYLANDAGERQSVITGSFKTAYVQPVELSVTRSYFTRNAVGLLYEITSLGEGGTSADLYVACGTSEPLTPTLHTSGLVTGSGSLTLTGLTPATTYYYAVYAKNQLGHYCPTITGSFTTNDDSSDPKWTGRVSSDWSDPRNWDPETTFTEGAEIERVFVTAFPGSHEPANLDVEGLTIKNLGFGRGGKDSFSVAGKPFTVQNLVSESGASGTVTVRNEITVKGTMNNNCNNGDVHFWFAGVIHQNPVAERVFYSGSYGNVTFSNPGNDFSARIEAHLGTFRFTCDGALGLPPVDRPTSHSVSENFGGIWLVPAEGKTYTPISLGPNRFLMGDSVAIYGYTDLTYEGVYGSYALVFNSAGGDAGSVRQVTFAGTPLALAPGDFSWNDSYRVGVGQNILLKVASADVAQDARRYFSTGGSGGTVDFNGYDVAMGLYNYSHGIAQNPNYINNGRGTTSVLSGPISLDYDFNVTFFGGAGDIVVDSEILAAERVLNKSGPGRLTFRGSTPGWTGGSSLYGPVTLDYTTKNAAKLGSGAHNPAIGFGEFRIKGHATEATESELSGINLHGGLTRFVTEPGAGGLTLNLTQGIQGIQRRRALDLTLGAGTTLTVPGLSNESNFGGVSPAVTLQSGAAWAMVDGSGNLVPLAGGTVATVTAESFNGQDYDSKVLDIKGGSHAFTTGGHWMNGLVFSGSGDTVLTLDGNLTLRKVGVQNVLAGILVSSACTGNVTIDGGSIAPQNYNSGIVLQNWNTNGIVRISSRLPETNDNDFYIVGPGTTVLANDGNTFYYGPHCLGGGTIRFTSVANRGSSSALGCGRNERGEIIAEDGAVYDYVGTAEEGHTTDRRFTIYGAVTLKANGAGPLVFNGSDAVAAGFSSCRVILDGAGEGVLNGSVNPGLFGSVVKRGSGVWAMNARGNNYVYPTEVEAGTLVLGGTLASDVIVRSGATLVLKPGAVIRRALTLEAGATLCYDNEAGTEPAVVLGEVALDGTLAFTRAVKSADGIVTVIETENGVSGAFDTLPPGLRPARHAADGALAFESPTGFAIVVR